MRFMILALAMLQASPQAAPGPVPEREKIAAAVVRWVADTRRVSPREIVVEPRKEAPEVGRAAASLGATVSEGRQAVACLGPEDVVRLGAASKVRSRCTMRFGSVLLHLSVTEVGEKHARARVLHISYGDDGYGVIHELDLEKKAGTWTVVAHRAVAAT